MKTDVAKHFACVLVVARKLRAAEVVVPCVNSVDALALGFLLEQVDERERLVLVEPRGRLVEQQEPGDSGQRAGDAEPPRRAVRECRGLDRGDVLQGEGLEQLLGARAGRPTPEPCQVSS